MQREQWISSIENVSNESAQSQINNPRAKPTGSVEIDPLSNATLRKSWELSVARITQRRQWPTSRICWQQLDSSRVDRAQQQPRSQGAASAQAAPSMNQWKLESVGDQPPPRKKPGWEWWELKMERIDQSWAKMPSGLINPDMLKRDHSEWLNDRSNCTSQLHPDLSQNKMNSSQSHHGSSK